MLSRDVYVRTALFGLVLYFVAVLLLATAVLLMHPLDVYFTLFFAVPGLIVAAAILLIRRWGLIAGILGGAFGLLALVNDVDLYLTTPQAFFDFSSNLVGMVGIVIVLFASLIGTVQHFRHHVVSNARALRPAFLTVSSILALALLISAILTALGATTSVSAADRDGAIVVTANRAEWDTKSIETTADEPLRILVKNEDAIMHTFTIYDLGIDERIGPWSEKLIVIEHLEPRIYGFICRIEGHTADMTGAIDAR